MSEATPADPTSDPAAPPSLAGHLRALAPALALQLAVLLAYFAAIGPGHHVTGLDYALNDEAGYVSVARNLLHEGRLESNLYLPGALPGPGQVNRLYMPGHYLSLAASLALCGDVWFAAVLPSLVASLLSLVGTYLLAYRLFGPSVARLASAIWALLPLPVVFAWTAMAELTFVAAGVVALVGVASAPLRWRPLLVPPLLVLPFLFRETGALLCFPALALLVPRGAERWPWRRLLASGAASVVLLSCVLALPFASQRNRLKAADRGYTDAAWTPEGSVPERLLRRTRGNLSRLPQLSGLELSGYAFWAAGLLAAAALLRGDPRDPLAWATLGLGLILMLLIVVTYETAHFRGARQLLFTFPWSCVVLARALSRVELDLRGRAGALLGACLLCAFFLEPIPAALSEHEGYQGQLRRFCEEHVAADADLATVFEVPSGWALHHPRSRVSFLPANDPTLELLAAKLERLTLLLPATHLERYSPACLARLGFELERIQDPWRRPWVLARRAATR